MPKDGDIKIEDGIVYMWHADIADWAPVLDNDGNPVSPEGYTETVAYTQSLSITISGNYVPAVDSETGKRLKTPEAVLVNVGNVASESENSGNAIYANASTDENPMDIAVNAESVSIALVSNTEFDPEHPNDSYVSATGVSAYTEQKGEQDATVTVTVAGDVNVSTDSNGATNAIGILEPSRGGSVSVEAENVNVSALGQTQHYEHKVLNNEGEVVSSFSSTDPTIATGVEIYTKQSSEPVAASEYEAKVKDVTVTAGSKPVEEGHQSLTIAIGVSENSSSADSTFTVETGNVTASAKDENENGYSRATGIEVSMCSSAGTVKSGDVTAIAEGSANTTATGINARAYEQQNYDEEKDEVVSAGPSSVTVTAGDVSAASENGGATGIAANTSNSGSEVAVKADNVTVSAASEDSPVNATGIIEGGQGGKTNVTAGDVTVTSQSVGETVREHVGTDVETGEEIFREGVRSGSGTGINVQIWSAEQGTERQVTAGNVTVRVETDKREDGTAKDTYTPANGVVARSENMDTALIVIAPPI